ncbi:MAG: aspartate carbamoyltransferase [Deltaproteobacteria bacterium]|jgi:aspartate carbamoyltransferase catalytic subunit|nr:aspartate carbamoyltransferase [Deltaproteobacteria bacterium]
MSQDIFHVLRSDQFDRSFLDELYEITNKLRKLARTKKGNDYLQTLISDKRAILYFTQPSTRTFLSFLNACQILGIQTSEIRDPNTSSEIKGETADDAIRTFSSYVDLIIMRSPRAGLADKIAKLLDETPRRVPVINGGSGKDEHPTQALLDIYTLRRSFGKSGGDIDGKSIAMVGDVCRGRTVRSLSRLMRHFEGAKVYFVSPDTLKIGDDLREDLKKNNVAFEETTDFENIIPVVDAIYMTRIQDEHDKDGESKHIDYSKFHFTYDHLKVLKKDAIIMHPLPRRKEIDVKVDADPRAKYWRQERNGMWTRVALIAKIFGIDKDITKPYGI